MFLMVFEDTYILHTSLRFITLTDRKQLTDGATEVSELPFIIQLIFL